MISENGTAEQTAAPAPQATQEKPVELHPQPVSRPKKPLPTPRISFAKQLDLLRAYGAASGISGTAAALNDVSAIAGMSPNTTTLANAFFMDAGFITKNDAGLFTASTAVQEFVHAHQWSPETAATKLATALRKHWAFQTLEPRLKFGRMSERDALQLLSETVGASPDYAPQLALVIEFLKVSGLVVLDGNLLQLGSASASSAEPPATETPATEEPARSTPGSRPSGVASTFTQQPEGLVQFGVSVRVDMAELSTWSPDRIAAFFGGIAQVLAAKGQVESVAGHRDGAA